MIDISKHSMADKSCYLYLHFPFDIGFNLGNSNGFDYLYNLVRSTSLNEKIPGLIWRIEPYIKLSPPKFLQEFNAGEFSVEEKTLRIVFDGFAEDTIPKSIDYTAVIAEVYISLFRTGIGIGCVKVKVTFENELNSKTLYKAFKHIHAQLDPLRQKTENSTVKSEPKLSNLLRTVIVGIRSCYPQFSSHIESKKIFKRNIREDDPIIYYIFPLFYLTLHNLEDLKQFLCLLYLRPDNSEITERELERALSYDASIYENEFLIALWDAALIVGNVIDENISDSYERIIELCSYIWDSIYVVDLYLFDELCKISAVKDKYDMSATKNLQIRTRGLSKHQSEISEAEANLAYIRELRFLALDVKNSYMRIKISLWASLIHFFDKILNDAWKLESLEKSLEAKIEMLMLSYQSAIHEIESTEASYTNRALVTFARFTIPLAAVIGLIPVLADRGNYSTAFTLSNLGTIYLPSVISIIIIVVIILIILIVDGHLVGKSVWKKLKP